MTKKQDLLLYQDQLNAFMASLREKKKGNRREKEGRKERKGRRKESEKKEELGSLPMSGITFPDDLNWDLRMRAAVF